MDPEDIHRTLPHSREAEMGVLGSMLVAPTTVIPDCVNAIRAVHFYWPAHATIYKVLLEMWTDDHPADVITLTQRLRGSGDLDNIGGPSYITQLLTFTPTAANAGYYIRIVQEQYVLRAVIEVGTSVATKAYDHNGEVDDLLDGAEKAIMQIRATLEPQQAPVEFKNDVMDAIEGIEYLYANRGSISGLTTGFSELDRMTNGLQPEEMYVIAARPSVGKTALAMNIAENAAETGASIGVFSLEMSRKQLTQRMLCSRARVNLQRLRDGFLTERDFPNLTQAASKLAEMKIRIDDRGGLSIMQLRAQARRWKLEHDIKLIVIDYLQLVVSDSRRAQSSRQVEVAEVSASIKSLAKELKIPIIVLAQLNRKPEERKTGLPKLSDLRESGSIEQDADLVGLLSRAEYSAEGDEEKSKVRGEALLEIAKNRNGPVGMAELTFQKEYTRFENRSNAAMPMATDYSASPFEDKF